MGRNDEVLIFLLYRLWFGLLEWGDGRGCLIYGSWIFVLYFDIIWILKISLIMMSIFCKRIFILLLVLFFEIVKIVVLCGLGIGNIILRCSIFWLKSVEFIVFVFFILFFLCKLCYVISFWLKK